MADVVAFDDENPDVPSPRMPAETLAQAVARAAAGMTNVTLAKRAGTSTRTLRAILNPESNRHFGRATLDKLDDALGWPTGRAWQLYQRQVPSEDQPLSVGLADSIREQMSLLSARLDAFRDEPLWAAQLIEACKPLSDFDRALLLGLAYRLNERR